MGSKPLAEERYVSITTFKRDGTPVSTPVWVAADDGTLLVHSEADSWKVKRIRRDPHVRLAPCSARGAVRGEPSEGEATIEDDTARVSDLLARKYGLMFRVVGAVTAIQRRLRRRSAPRSVAIRITLR